MLLSRLAAPGLLSCTLSAFLLVMAVPGFAQESAPPEAGSWWDGDTMTGDWGGARETLEERGVTLEGTLVADWTRTQKGGRRPHESALRSWAAGWPRSGWSSSCSRKRCG